MNIIEKLCLELCESFFSTFSVTDIILKHSVKFSHGTEKTVEVVLTTKEDEYMFVLNLPQEEVDAETDSPFYICLRCASDNKYDIKSVTIKGYDAVEFGKIDTEYLWVILEMLAEDHTRCLEKSNLEKNNKYYTVSHKRESFFDTLQEIVAEMDKSNIDVNTLRDGIKMIEDAYDTLLESDEDIVFVHGNILQKKLFVKSSKKSQREYKILSTKTEQSFPLAYDVLLTIFSFTDQTTRQYHFHQLLDHYYKCLQKKLQKLSLDVTKCLPLARFQSQVHKFLPSVKLDTLKQCCQAFSNQTRRKNLEQYETIRTAILEISECFSHPNLSREDCYKILKNKIGSSDYTLLNYSLIPLQEREGYLGDYFKLKIEVEYDGNVKLLHLFSKYLPTYNEMVLDLAIDSFKKEEFYYLKFIPELNDLGLEDITNFLPECYFSRTNEVLIFEDMTMRNYKTVHVSVPYSCEMLLITIKQLAKIHASSLLYEELLSKKTNEDIRIDAKYPEYVEEKTICKKETPTKKTLDCAITTFLNMLSKFPDIPKKMSMEEFQKRGQLAFDLCFEKVKKSDRFRNVLCQGDCWASNILFKTDKDNIPIDCCLVDYQLTRYCPPAHDLMYLFYMATTKEIRTKYKSKLLREYYSELSNILQRYKIDLKKIYTYQQFLECCEYMRSQGLCQAVMILQFVLFPEEKLKNIFKNKEQVSRLFYVNRDIFIEELQHEGAYSQRMKEIAEELYEICENMKL